MNRALEILAVSCELFTALVVLLLLPGTIS
jgi:hypothetical protein